MTNPRRRWWAPVAIGAIAAVMIAVVIFGNNNGAPEPAVTPQHSAGAQEAHQGAGDPGAEARVALERREEGDPLSVGSVEAPVGIVMYSDFQCGFCAVWSTQTLPTVLEYVDAGQVRLEWRDLALFGEASHRAALAAHAAGQQGEYLAFNRALFATGNRPDAALLSDEGLTTLASGLGLDVEQFTADRTGAVAATRVQENIAEARAVGANSTPSFLLNGRPVVGAQPTEVFVAMIEEELAAQP